MVDGAEVLAVDLKLLACVKQDPGVRVAIRAGLEQPALAPVQVGAAAAPLDLTDDAIRHKAEVLELPVAVLGAHRGRHRRATKPWRRGIASGGCRGGGEIQQVGDLLAPAGLELHEAPDGGCEPVSSAGAPQMHRQQRGAAAAGGRAQEPLQVGPRGLGVLPRWSQGERGPPAALELEHGLLHPLRRAAVHQVLAGNQDALACIPVTPLHFQAALHNDHRMRLAVLKILAKGALAAVEVHQHAAVLHKAPSAPREEGDVLHALPQESGVARGGQRLAQRMHRQAEEPRDLLTATLLLLADAKHRLAEPLRGLL